MSASPVFSSAALGRPFLLDASGAVLRQWAALPKLPASVTRATQLEVRPSPEMVSSGIRELDALTGGFPRGCLTEICGPASSGRTSILLSALAQTTRRGEVCALVDASDMLDPASAVAAGVVMGRMLWVRCGRNISPQRHGGTEKNVWSSSPVEPRVDNSNHGTKPVPNNQKIFSVSPCLRGENGNFSEHRLEQVLKVTDLLLQSNGFGMIALDLGDIPAQSARRIPMASWFRFRRAVEHTPTVLLVIEQQPIAGSCSSVLMKVSGAGCRVSGEQSAISSQQSAGSMTHTKLLDEREIEVELLRSRLERKPVRSAVTNFRSHAAWR